jgi:hypothetical protein
MIASRAVRPIPRVGPWEPFVLSTQSHTSRSWSRSAERRCPARVRSSRAGQGPVGVAAHSLLVGIHIPNVGLRQDVCAGYICVLSLCTGEAHRRGGVATELPAGRRAGCLRSLGASSDRAASGGTAVGAVPPTPLALAPRAPWPVTGLDGLPNRPEHYEQEPDERDRKENHTPRLAARGPERSGRGSSLAGAEYALGG